MIPEKDIGQQMWSWAYDLFPILRSITGKGVRETFEYMSKVVPQLKVYNFKSGEKVFNWTIPDEWNLKSAYIENDKGDVVLDYKNNNLHIVSYSESINKKMSLSELDEHLYSLPSQKTAIPYVTSYYKKNWGFCLAHEQRIKLNDGIYKVCIDSEIKPGEMNYGEIIIPGESKEEIFLSTYICHPSMANNELSGPVVLMALANWLYSLKKRRYTYRIIFVPETIGSIAYLSKNLEEMKKNIVAGFVLTCVGDDLTYSYVPSRQGDTLADIAAIKILDSLDVEYKKYSFLDRGSDERQYCSPGVDLPVCSVMRSKYIEYPEYHTSLDNLDFVTSQGLMGGLMVYKKIIKLLESNYRYKATNLCEPQLGKYNLYPEVGTKESYTNVTDLLNFLAYADGDNDLIKISELIKKDVLEVMNLALTLERNNLIYAVSK